jgi:purine-binding chemotaxis protein CheW
MLYLLFSAGQSIFAVDALKVQEMVVIPHTVHVPNQPEWFRGVISLRGRTYRVVDFRKKIGMQGSLDEIEELIQELDERESEHKAWINALEDALMNDTEFTGGTDPHLCQFGDWYDHYESANVAVAMELKKFDTPHKAIHATAVEALDLKNSGKQAEAMQLIRSRRDTELARMINLFEVFKETLRSTVKEIAIIIETGDRPDAICVDSVVAVERLQEEAALQLSFAGDSETSLSRNATIGHRHGREDLVLILKPEWIFSGTEKLDPEKMADLLSSAIRA